MAHSSSVSVDVRIVPDSTFLLTSCHSEQLPMFFESGWDSDGVLVLSRENSEKLFLSRENSLSRESSEKLALGKEIFDQPILSRETSDFSGASALSRENSDKFSVCLGRENSGFLPSLANETTGCFKRIISVSSNEWISSSATCDKIENAAQQQLDKPSVSSVLANAEYFGDIAIVNTEDEYNYMGYRPELEIVEVIHTFSMNTPGLFLTPASFRFRSGALRPARGSRRTWAR